MPKGFTWERGPFVKCPNCQLHTLGILSAGGHSLQFRCIECRYSQSEALPDVDKATIYLDQFVFGSIFGIKAGAKPPIGHGDFYQELIPLLKRLLLFQQAIFPHSNIHSQETIVFHDAKKLRNAYEDIGGDIALEDSNSVEQSQIFTYARAFRDKKDPILSFDVDDILEDERNVWLPDMRIGIDADYSQFAAGLRQERDDAYVALSALVERWTKDKPSFRELLEREIDFGAQRQTVLAEIIQRMREAQNSGDMDALYKAAISPVWVEYKGLLSLFNESGETNAAAKVFEFWNWPKLRELPFHQISAYLIAAFGQRVSSGQRKFTQGFLNDVRAIAAYSPYVDAMFLDRECASLLREGDLPKELKYKAKIYSYANADEFLDYLRELDAKTPSEVKDYAERIYGVKLE